MATINIRIDDELKARSHDALEKLGVTPSALLRGTLQYVADEGRLPLKQALLTNEDAALLLTARERLRAPDPVKPGYCINRTRAQGMAQAGWRHPCSIQTQSGWVWTSPGFT